MKIRYLIYIIGMTLLTVSCSKDGSETQGSVTTITLPIDIYTGHGSEDASTMLSRGTANPGLDDELPAPEHLYVWMWAKLQNGTYFFDYKEVNCGTSGQWTYTTGSTGSENQNSRWKYNATIEYKVIDLERGMSARDCMVYVIASKHALTIPEELKANSADTRTGVPALVLDFNGWTPTDLRDLYSTPGGVSFDFANNTFSADLYHCAAKLDFQWEVAKALQPTTWVRQITISSLPTQCKVFEPTNNPTTKTDNTTPNTDGTATISTEIDNKWIGRKYTYALQPSSGTINYQVTFGGSANKSPVSKSLTHKNDTYTTWYREIATIQ